MLKNSHESSQDVDQSIQVDENSELAGDLSELSNLSCQIEVQQYDMGMFYAKRTNVTSISDAAHFASVSEDSKWNIKQFKLHH